MGRLHRKLSALSGFRLDNQVPTWTYLCSGCGAWNSASGWRTAATRPMQVQAARSQRGCRLELNPLCTYRDYHSHTQGGWSMERTFRSSKLPGDGFPRRTPLSPVGSIAASSLPILIGTGVSAIAPKASGAWTRLEDSFTPGHFELDSNRAKPSHSLSHPRRKNRIGRHSQRARLAAEAIIVSGNSGRCARVDQATYARRRSVHRQSCQPDRRRHHFADGKTVIAGYPWFSDWGPRHYDRVAGMPSRPVDTADAASILRTFAQHTSQGMLPNRFPDGGESPEYNTVDAGALVLSCSSLRTSKRPTIKPPARRLPDSEGDHQLDQRGTRYSIRVDPRDGLLHAGEARRSAHLDGRQDRRLGRHTAYRQTRRDQRPVALRAGSNGRVGAYVERPTGGDALRGSRQRVAASYSDTFWFEEGGYLYDVVDGPDDPWTTAGATWMRAFRPNQIFAVSLGTELLDPHRARAVVETCCREC